MFNLNLIIQTIDCVTGNIIPHQQIVDACLTEGRTVSLVFEDSKIAVVNNGIVLTSDIASSMLARLETVLAKDKELREARKTVKRLEAELKDFQIVPNAVDLKDLAEGDTVVLRNGNQFKVDIISCMEPNRYTISDGDMHIDCYSEGTSRYNGSGYDVVQIIKA